MHLLNAKTKRLELFYGDRIPPYAILSHLWGREEDEVLFKHIAGSNDDRCEGEKRKGYAKLVAACKQAIEDRWEYIWIDTCCINKESSAELSEAINSMYAWYQHAQVCYAYLEDVRAEKQDYPEERYAQKGNQDPISEYPSFKDSRWFLRGWTLQELLAPRSLIFYAQDWAEIGTKGTLQDVISAVTLIRPKMIMAYDPKEASVAERMSWAMKRSTTRTEDIAYCLMGLFGVNMPLLYGEGNKAFRRLQEEIMKVSDDHSLFAWEVIDTPYTMQESGGLLADSPSQFFNSGDVVRSDGAYSYSMTNKGIYIQLPLIPLDPKEDSVDFGYIDHNKTFKAILNCTIGDKQPTRWVVIYLERVKESYYVRNISFPCRETSIDPKGLKLTPLFVTQNNDGNDFYLSEIDVEVKILPTDSGFTFQGHNLVHGYDHLPSFGESPEVLVFDREGKHFAVMVGFHNRIIWSDVIEDIDWGVIDEIEVEVIEPNILTFPPLGDPRHARIRRFYNGGGSRHDAVMRYRDRLSVDIWKEWSVFVSARMVRQDSSNYNIPAIQATIHIQKILQ